MVKVECFEKLTKEILTDLILKIRVAYVDRYMGSADRKIEIFHSDGYGNEGNRSWFFCVQGSPNPFVGYIRVTGFTEYLMLETNFGKFYVHHKDKGYISRNPW